MTHWTVKLEVDPETGDLIMPLTPDMLSQMGWDTGDTLLWEEMDNGSWSLRKQDSGTAKDATE
jgi:hypothetical protein